MTFTVPTIYTAIDKFSQVVDKMGKNAAAFANKAEAGVARVERVYRKLTPALSGAAKQFLQFASAAAISAAIVGGVNFSISSMKDYETAVQSFRTIVSDLTDNEFSAYQNKINEVAKATNKSSIETAQAFEKVAGLNAKFAETSEGIGEVTKAAITLSKASRDELGASAESLVGIMNQFSLSANQADRTINVLAAGTAVGASSIVQTAEAFVNFGAVASSANITLEESVALVQTLGKFSIFGSEAGNKLKGAILRIQKAGIGYKSGLFNINDALAEAKGKVDKLSSAKAKDALLTKIFGAENIAAGRILLSNIDLYKEFTKGVTGTNAAQKAADINSQTLTVALDELKNAWVNMITGSEKATSALNSTKTVVRFLTNNLDTIVSIGSKILIFFIAWKALLVTSRVILTAYNIILGINSALTGASSIAMKTNTVALAAQSIVLKAVTAAQWLLNAAMTANPIGIIIVAIAALIALIVVAVKYYNEWGAALLFLLGPLGWVVNLIQSFRRNWDMIKESFASGGIIGGIKAIGAVLLDAVLMPLQQILKIIANVTGAEWAKNGMNTIEQMRKNLGVNVTTDESGNPLQEKKQLINPEVSRQESLTESIKTSRQDVGIEIKDKTGRASVDKGRGPIPIKLTSTQ